MNSMASTIILSLVFLFTNMQAIFLFPWKKGQTPSSLLTPNRKTRVLRLTSWDVCTHQKHVRNKTHLSVWEMSVSQGWICTKSLRWGPYNSVQHREWACWIGEWWKIYGGLDKISLWFVLVWGLVNHWVVFPHVEEDVSVFSSWVSCWLWTFMFFMIWA